MTQEQEEARKKEHRQEIEKMKWAKNNRKTANKEREKLKSAKAAKANSGGTPTENKPNIFKGKASIRQDLHGLS